MSIAYDSRWVLYVEDEDSQREILTREGISIHSVSSGAEALVAIEDHGAPAAIVTDLVLPGVLGVTLIEYTRSHEELQHVPLAIVTGSPQLAPKGCVVFTKPVAFARLLEFVKAHTTA
jgi:CheY-like chemotaxis protein